MNDSLQDIIVKLYYNKIIPRLTKKNKLIIISTAIVTSIVYLLINRVFKPPRKLRHIPYNSYYGFIKSIFAKETSRNDLLPKKHEGLSLEIGIFGWQLSVTNIVDAKYIFMKSEIFPKAELVHGTLLGKLVGGANIATTNGEYWKKQRKVISPAFRRSVPVKLFGSIVKEMFKAMETTEAIETKNIVVDVSDIMERWTLDVIGKAVFGFDFNASSNRNNLWVKRYNNISKGLADPKYYVFPKLDSEFVWLFSQRKQLHKEMDLFLEMIDDIIQERKMKIKIGDIIKEKTDDNERNLLDLMMDSGEDENDGLNDEELKSNICIFIRAGHDTTAHALTFAIHHLAQNQDIQERARKEAIEILGDQPIDISPTVEETKRMLYINQIIKETLRINPPGVRTLPRISNKDTELSGTFIPKGTPVVIKMFDIHRSEKLWKNPNKFDPERFSENGEAFQSSERFSGWIPFGDGTRQCIGMNFSLSQQRVMLSMLLRKFTWVTPENSIHKNGPVVAGTNIVGPIELDIKFTRRY